MFTRRTLLSLLLSPVAAHGQMASRGVRPANRRKATGLPYSRLTDVAREAGLNAPVIYGGIDKFTYIIEATGCGLAFIDYDNDGWIDIFLLSGSRLENTPPGATNRLYKNNRDGTFTDVTEKAGLKRAGWAFGVTVGDYNNDGFEDIFVTYWGQNVLYRNNGDGTFSDVTKQAGLLEPRARWSTGCTFVDFDRDGHLDLFVSHYVVFHPSTVPPTGKDPNCNFKGVPTNCGPMGLRPEKHSLYRNNGDGTFKEVSVDSNIAASDNSYGLTAAAADFDDDGWPDIYVACDSTPSLFFHNGHDGTFAEEGLQRGVALSEDGLVQAGMGLGIGDFDLDGRIDILKTHFTEDTPALLANRGKGNFADVTMRMGLGVETRYISWGAGIVDLDNNGWPDLFWVTGSVFPEVEKRLPHFPHRTPRVLFRNLEGKGFEQLFDEAGPALSEAHVSRGCAFGDFDNDGDLDVLILNMNEPPSLVRNDAPPENHWLKFKLIGVQSNRSAIGARVTLRYGDRVQAQEVLAQSGYLSVNDRRLHFGIGAATNATAEIRWPNGAREQISDTGCDQLLTIKEGAGVISRERLKERTKASAG